MIHKYFLLELLFACSALTSVIHCNLPTTKIEQKDTLIEGYIILEVKALRNIDKNGLAHETIGENDTVISHRKMHLQNNCLIDIIGHDNFLNRKYINTDTL